MDEEPEHTLLYPLIVCKTNGGPYEDDAFVAGCYFGHIETLCQTLDFEHEIYEHIPSPLAPQIDLLVMHEKCSMTAEPCEEHSEWTHVIIRRIPREA